MQGVVLGVDTPAWRSAAPRDKYLARVHHMRSLPFAWSDKVLAPLGIVLPLMWRSTGNTGPRCIDWGPGIVELVPATCAARDWFD